MLLKCCIVHQLLMRLLLGLQAAWRAVQPLLTCSARPTFSTPWHALQNIFVHNERSPHLKCGNFARQDDIAVPPSRTWTLPRRMLLTTVPRAASVLFTVASSAAASLLLSGLRPAPARSSVATNVWPALAGAGAGATVSGSTSGAGAGMPPEISGVACSRQGAGLRLHVSFAEHAVTSLQMYNLLRYLGARPSMTAPYPDCCPAATGLLPTHPPTRNYGGGSGSLGGQDMAGTNKQHGHRCRGWGDEVQGHWGGYGCHRGGGGCLHRCHRGRGRRKEGQRSRRGSKHCHWNRD